MLILEHLVLTYASLALIFCSVHELRYKTDDPAILILLAVSVALVLIFGIHCAEFWWLQYLSVNSNPLS